MNVNEVPLIMTNKLLMSKSSEVPDFESSEVPDFDIFGKSSEVKGCFINNEYCN
jgi:hypothetical protein